LLTANGVLVTNEGVVPAGQRQVAIQVQAIDNAVQETRSRRVQASLVAAGSFAVDPELAEVNFVDNDVPTVAIIASDARAGEPAGTNSNPGVFYFLREGSNGAPLTVYFTLSGTAANGTDYSTLSSPVTIPAGSNAVTISVAPIHDTNYEGSETVVATLVAHSSYAIHPILPAATVTIADNDLPVINFVGTDLVATESNLKAAVIGLQRSGSTALPLTVSLAVTGTATNGVDYSPPAPTVTFPSNVSNVSFNLTPLADGVEEQV
jgi:hypothetical protein